MKLNTTREERLALVMNGPPESAGPISEANAEMLVTVAADAVVLEDRVVELERLVAWLRAGPQGFTATFAEPYIKHLKSDPPEGWNATPKE